MRMAVFLPHFGVLRHRRFEECRFCDQHRRSQRIGDDRVAIRTVHPRRERVTSKSDQGRIYGLRNLDAGLAYFCDLRPGKAMEFGLELVAAFVDNVPLLAQYDPRM